MRTNIEIDDRLMAAAMAAGGFKIKREGVERAAADIYRALRVRGVTVRSSIDLLIGAWCIENEVPLLHSGRDFEGMARHHGLQIVGRPAERRRRISNPKIQTRDT